jgi:PAB-dependent poly(A)-specific ribonuclease subunit 2
MDSSWSEVQHICDPNLSKVSPVSAVCWDPYHELLWVGNDSVSFYFLFLNVDVCLIKG